MKHATKRTKQAPAGKRCISANEETFKQAEARMKSLRMDSFSEYCRHLIRQDLVAAENAK